MELTPAPVRVTDPPNLGGGRKGPPLHMGSGGNEDKLGAFVEQNFGMHLSELYVRGCVHMKFAKFLPLVCVWDQSIVLAVASFAIISVLTFFTC